MARQGRGSMFATKDGRYFVYLPKDLVEDTAFPFPPKSSVHVKICFKAGKKELIIEEA
ncbi:MAG: hypothetical protein WBF08_02365 [Candidatus Bathyarchaeia archaeon]